MIPSIEQHTGFHITNQHVFSEGYVVVFNAYCISQESKTRISKNNMATNLIMSLALYPTCLKSKLRWSPSKGRSQILDSLPISSGKNLKSGL